MKSCSQFSCPCGRFNTHIYIDKCKRSAYGECFAHQSIPRNQTLLRAHRLHRGLSEMGASGRPLSLPGCLPFWGIRMALQWPVRPGWQGNCCRVSLPGRCLHWAARGHLYWDLISRKQPAFSAHVCRPRPALIRCCTEACRSFRRSHKTQRTHEPCRSRFRGLQLLRLSEVVVAYYQQGIVRTFTGSGVVYCTLRSARSSSNQSKGDALNVKANSAPHTFQY